MDILSSLANIGFDWKVALANLVNFLIVFILLNKFIFKPVSKTLDERRKKIEEGIENAQKAQTNLLMADKVYEEKLSEAQVKANEIIALAQGKGNELVHEAGVKATEEAQRIILEAEDTIEERKKAMEREIREKTADLVIVGLERILHEEIDEKKNTKIIHSLLHRT